MEIAVFISIDFANENSKLYKSIGNSKGRRYVKNHKGEDELRDHNLVELDRSTYTTLSKLYQEGWRIASQSMLQLNWHIFFMERD